MSYIEDKNFKFRAKWERWFRITDTRTGNISFIRQEQIGAVTFNAAETSATIYMSFTVPGQGNNQQEVVIEVTGQDAIDLAQGMEEAHVVDVTGASAGP